MRFSSSKSRGWGKLQRRLLDGPTSFRRRIIITLHKAAKMAEAELRNGLRSGSPGGERFQRLSPLTIAMNQGRRKPLMDSGTLFNSISSTVDEREFEAFIGVKRTAKASNGQDLVDIAAVHEFGSRPFAVRVTPQIRSLFIALSKQTDGRISPISPSKSVIFHPGIPKRPFIAPTLRVVRPKVEAMIGLVMAEGGGPL